MKKKFQSIDAFGQSLTLTYNGDGQFKTTLGASVTTVLGTILLAYFAYRSNVLVNRLSPLILKYSLSYNMTEVEEYRPQDTGFDFAFGI